MDTREEENEEEEMESESCARTDFIFQRSVDGSEDTPNPVSTGPIVTIDLTQQPISELQEESQQPDRFMLVNGTTAANDNEGTAVDEEKSAPMLIDSHEMSESQQIIIEALPSANLIPKSPQRRISRNGRELRGTTPISDREKQALIKSLNRFRLAYTNGCYRIIKLCQPGAYVDPAQCQIVVSADRPKFCYREIHLNKTTGRVKVKHYESQRDSSAHSSLALTNSLEVEHKDATASIPVQDPVEISPVQDPSAIHTDDEKELLDVPITLEPYQSDTEGELRERETPDNMDLIIMGLAETESSSSSPSPVQCQVTPSKPAPPKATPSKSAPLNSAPPKATPSKADPLNSAPPKATPSKAAPLNSAPSKAAPSKAASPKPAPLKAVSPKPASSKAAPSKAVSPKPASSKAAPLKATSPKPAPSKAAPLKATSPKPASSKATSSKTAPTKTFAPPKTTPSKADLLQPAPTKEPKAASPNPAPPKTTLSEAAPPKTTQSRTAPTKAVPASSKAAPLNPAIPKTAPLMSVPSKEPKTAKAAPLKDDLPKAVPAKRQMSSTDTVGPKPAKLVKFSTSPSKPSTAPKTVSFAAASFFSPNKRSSNVTSKVKATLSTKKTVVADDSKPSSHSRSLDDSSTSTLPVATDELPLAVAVTPSLDEATISMERARKIMKSYWMHYSYTHLDTYSS